MFVPGMGCYGVNPLTPPDSRVSGKEFKQKCVNTPLSTIGTSFFKQSKPWLSRNTYLILPRWWLPSVNINLKVPLRHCLNHPTDTSPSPACWFGVAAVLLARLSLSSCM